ncbi:conjugal transfer protein TrbL [Microbacterium sp. zg.Y625]|uniref:conjugal transfer protein TrbL n=1 Tax=Microbacterium jiangjiandongii TaxID=3049071 RepID=UPI00214B24EE|nr:MULTISPECIES: conjugal transfer protein TrbL [unclassified Microbacterium]MCR2792766.1 conjugal transfer protein TrbL [Microbacterium sp. zg.Y625]WIM26743.1 conjugal transfer protein TrbL [Microbacterium sp. zg-Y625]
MDGVCDIPVIAEVCQTVGSGVASLVAAPFDWLAHTLAASAAWFFQAVWAVFDTTTLVDVTGEQYIRVYNLLFGVALFVMLIFFCLQLITGLAHRDPAALSRAAVGLGKSVLGSFVVITLTATLLEITDRLAIGIVQATGNTMEGMGDRIALMATGLVAINITSPGVGAIMTIFLAGLAIAASAIVWFSLLIRKALLLVAIVFAPIALAGFSWDAARGWFGKWAAFVVALVFSKLVLVVLFLVAINQTAAPIDLDLASISDPVAGVVLMLVAAFAPYMTYKFISFVGVDMYHAMSTEQEAKGAMNRPIPVPVTPATAKSAKSILDGGGAASSGSAPPAAAKATSGAAGSGGSTAASGGAAAAGPATAAVIGGQVATKAAGAGPKLGSAAGTAAEGHAEGAAPADMPPGSNGSQPGVAPIPPPRPTATPPHPFPTPRERTTA